ncbi:aromatic ring-hydroxylating oxygenase subunit alpha [Sphingomonas profundi]|uniref:aromatic ring-hydroxylating oxygenase subunit alpha n=1 Tax=Alterirhizorhabdus profundi TaxID=2681549 RepID=UPI0018D19ACD|nr:aromatic ring-hydroxylating dioxygenase subunit alpha [Sphingomonas profundi]
MDDTTARFRADRHPSESYEDILERDTRAIPDHLRQGPTRDLGDEGIPASDYYDRDHFAKEVRHVWLKVWQWACREEDIPNPNDVFVYENVGKNILVVRQEDGGIKAFYNSCLHRGRKLADGPGNKVDLRCKYHGLAWHCSGAFKHNPIGWDFPQFQRMDMSLPEVRVETWGGFVFVNFDPAAKPLMDTLQPLADHFDRYDFANRYKAAHTSKVVPCNWKVMAEAFMESHHTIVTHPQLAPFLGDVNSQYDALSDHVTRQFTATGVVSPMLADRRFGDMDILKAMAAAGGSHVAGGRSSRKDGEVAKRPVRARESVGTPDALEEGVTARMHTCEVTRAALGAEDGWDYAQVSDAEIIDALLYNVFPHMSFWAGYAPNVVYRWRPNGLDPETSIMDVIILKRVPKNGPRPQPVKEHRLALDEDWSSSPMLGALGPVFEQDMDNLPQVQEGLRASGTGLVHFALYSEMRIRLLHVLIARMIAQGEARAGA